MYRKQNDKTKQNLRNSIYRQFFVFHILIWVLRICTNTESYIIYYIVQFVYYYFSTLFLFYFFFVLDSLPFIVYIIDGAERMYPRKKKKNGSKLNWMRNLVLLFFMDSKSTTKPKSFAHSNTHTCSEVVRLKSINLI